MQMCLQPRTFMLKPPRQSTATREPRSAAGGNHCACPHHISNQVTKRDRSRRLSPAPMKCRTSILVSVARIPPSRLAQPVRNQFLPSASSNSALLSRTLSELAKAPDVRLALPIEDGICEIYDRGSPQLRCAEYWHDTHTHAGGQRKTKTRAVNRQRLH